jgi:hypothetical protein
VTLTVDPRCRALQRIGRRGRRTTRQRGTTKGREQLSGLFAITGHYSQFGSQIAPGATRVRVCRLNHRQRGGRQRGAARRQRHFRDRVPGERMPEPELPGSDGEQQVTRAPLERPGHQFRGYARSPVRAAAGRNDGRVLRRPPAAASPHRPRRKAAPARSPGTNQGSLGAASTSSTRNGTRRGRAAGGGLADPAGTAGDQNRVAGIGPVVRPATAEWLTPRTAGSWSAGGLLAASDQLLRRVIGCQGGTRGPARGGRGSRRSPAGSSRRTRTGTRSW